ncbi:hypothetical protein EJ05DRAFT_507379 [Pseudovirgaria hyperparasitica]|uniref:Leo1-domain-containing protein n=1 Tax=Pseudovirgaria hyperparasitica TaxID=470096 RepID=A0A6A6WIC6_9PEZI|nr:uncharacterized protein EJ05DRAFT_507379 [Pseudovirgaria hyperparasitica]KAF2761746.1 hypothetical protein EJ05DRAFT_507379 [Pseudovirgaria hyperparasitica]
MSDSGDNHDLAQSVEAGNNIEDGNVQQSHGAEDGTALDNSEDDIGNDEDLFGDDDDGNDEIAASSNNIVETQDVDSPDDDLHKYARGGSEESPQDENEEIQQAVIELQLPRHKIPEGHDQELYLLKVARFLAMQHAAWDHLRFQPPTTDHHSAGPPSDTFSAYNTAMTTIRWRVSPSDRKELQSNARLLRWSDGSLTLQLASDPLNQYEIEGNALAPPQRNPPKPTPTSLKGIKGKTAATGYNVNQDSFTYLVSPYLSQGVMRTTNKITAGLTIQPTANTVDEAREKLEKNIAMHGKGEFGLGASMKVENIGEDPEMEKRRAEAAEREKTKMARSREKQVIREQERSNRRFQQSGIGRSNLGLSVGGLEGEGRSSGKGASRAKPRRRRDDYSDDEEYGGRRYTKEDDYDEEDDFIAGSDEEEEVADDDDPDDGIMDRASPKRSRAGKDQADDEDDDEVTTTSRHKRRRVVDEDDDDDE